MPRTEPMQKRSTKRLDQIRSAAIMVYNARGRDYFTTLDVAKAAGCSIGTVYRYYEDRVAIMDDIHPDRDQSLIKESE